MKQVAIVAAAVFCLLACRPAYGYTAVDKFGRGVCNLATFYCELGYQSVKEKEAHGSVAGMTTGVARGIYMSVARALVGVYEVATFALPYPKDYGPILKDPESFFPQPKKQTP